MTPGEPLGVLRIADILTFLSVVRHRSVSRAARERNVTTSQVSKSIARLEKQVKQKLFPNGANLKRMLRMPVTEVYSDSPLGKVRMRTCTAPSPREGQKSHHCPRSESFRPHSRRHLQTSPPCSLRLLLHCRRSATRLQSRYCRLCPGFRPFG